MLLRMSKKINLNKFINLYQMKNSNKLHTSVQNLSIVNPKIEVRTLKSILIKYYSSLLNSLSKIYYVNLILCQKLFLSKFSSKLYKWFL